MSFIIVKIKCLTEEGIKRLKRLEQQKEKQEAMGLKPIDVDDEEHYEESHFEYRQGAIQLDHIVAMYPSSDGETLYIDTPSRDYTVKGKLDAILNIEILQGQDTSINE